jgi:glycosyltransferase involved in cell wall biosynthesis
MTAPRVTVLIDTYNYGRFIEEAIDSVLAQDFPMDQVQILVVDDGSTDDTRQRVAKYLSQLRYLYKPNGGQASAFNFGLAQATGEYIVLLDADDFWLPAKLRRVVEEFDAHPEVGMLYDRVLKFDMAAGTREPEDFVNLSGYLPDQPEALFRYEPHATSFVSYRKKLIDQLLPVPEGLTIQADGHFALILPFIAHIRGIPECLGVYRIHGSNLFYGEQSEMREQQMLRRVATRQLAIDDVRSWLSNHGFDLSRPEFRAFFARWDLYQQNEQFALNPPGRRRFFRHLLLYNRYYGPRTTRRLRMINRVNAFAALVTGYKHFYLLANFWSRIARPLAAALHLPHTSSLSNGERTATRSDLAKVKK